MHTSNEKKSAVFPEKVECGAPPRRNHSTVDPTAKVHNETVDYLCERGYSVDEEPQGNTNGRFEVRCSHTGSYVLVRSGAEQCLPVVCADVPDVSDVVRQDELRKTVFHSVASWQCKPGFSNAKVVGGNRAVTAHCRWNGTFYFQSSVTTVTTALGISADRTACVGTIPYQRAIISMTTLVIANLVLNRRPSR